MPRSDSGCVRRTRFLVIGTFALAARGIASAQSPGVKRRVRPTYPIAEHVVTTRRRTVVPDLTQWGFDSIYPYEVAKYHASGYGTWRYGPGIDSVKRYDLMPATSTGADPAGGMAIQGPAPGNVARLLSFFTISDIHITDKESPAQAIAFGYKGLISSAYSPVMLYTTHVLDAAVQTINAIHAQTPIDFGISLGDAANNTQYNELRWYIDVLDGNPIVPRSGRSVPEDPVPGPANDYQDPYQPAGLDPAIPWYQALGNHDHFWMGSIPVDAYLRQTYVGDAILNLGNVLVDGTKSRGVYMGTIDGRTPYGNVIGVGPTSAYATPPKVNAADPNRRSLTRQEWIGEFFTTTSQPRGHGFAKSNVDGDFASYSFDPKPGLPLTMIVLDDTQSDGDTGTMGYGHGTLDERRYSWLVSQLDAGQAAGKLMIVAAHVPIGVEPAGSVVGWWSGAYVSEERLIAKLHEYPNLILWVAGHRHVNAITPFTSPQPDHPELGFWQVETSSLRDFPQQFRTFQIVRNSDATLSIFATGIDPAVAPGSLAATSRGYAVAAQQLFRNQLSTQPTGAANAELVIALSAEMQRKLQQSGTPLRT